MYKTILVEAAAVAAITLIGQHTPLWHPHLDSFATTCSWTKQILNEGTGPTPRVGDKITVHCTGERLSENAYSSR